MYSPFEGVVAFFAVPVMNAKGPIIYLSAFRPLRSSEYFTASTMDLWILSTTQQRSGFDMEILYQLVTLPWI